MSAAPCSLSSRSATASRGARVPADSRRATGLWRSSEVLEVGGRLGGLNFQVAWSSGTVAGREAATCAIALDGKSHK